MLCKAFTLSRAANRVSCLAGCAGCAVLHHWVHEANHNSRVTFLVKVYFRTMFDDYFLPTLTIRPPPQRLLYISFFFLVHVFLFCPSLQATKAAEFKVGPRYVDSKYIGEGVSCRVFRRACFPNAIPPVPLRPPVTAASQYNFNEYMVLPFTFSTRSLCLRWLFLDVRAQTYAHSKAVRLFRQIIPSFSFIHFFLPFPSLSFLGLRDGCGCD